MSDFTVRPLVEGEQRVCHTLLAQALHSTVVSDEVWESICPSFPAERKFAAFDGESPVGVASSFASELMVPGGALVSMGAVDGVAVRADWTRRGVMTAMMTAQLADLVARGHVLAGLHASEATIYGRFGYGAATVVKSVRVTRSAARWRPNVPVTGQVRLLDPADAVKRIPGLYRRCGLGPGMMTRPDRWWPIAHDRKVVEGFQVAVHRDPHGEDGYVTYRTTEVPGRGVQLDVRELHAATDEARAGLWRFVLGVDLVDEVHAPGLAVDEPVGGFLTNPRACRTASVDDELWLRLLDVDAALNARSYQEAEPVVVDVQDDRLPANAGRYLIGPSGAERTTAAAQLRLGVDALAMLYLGDSKATTLVRTGRVDVLDPDAPARLDELFRTAERPWCGTHF
jgi:predicted acetyltransferase